MIFSVLAGHQSSATTIYLHKESDSRIITINDFGALGDGGTNDFRFVFKNYVDHSNALTFSIELNMHYKAPLQLTGLKATVDVDTVIPNGTAPSWISIFNMLMDRKTVNTDLPLLGFCPCLLKKAFSVECVR